ncbi:hypothetical protein VNI00_013685 [Paramarasmius palmivorus]|uniref:Glycoside hydrolase family 76 protein n=1 Tax=Paramarasmius palmivorus TaxID=297713 RepID=A0AAW0BVI7_9AGAR
MFRVSASLADSIKDTTHVQAAEESFNFIKDGLLWENLMVPVNWSKPCDGAEVGFQDPKTTGIVIEAVSVLAKTAENATIEEQLIRNLTLASITGTNDQLEGPWVSDSGVIGAAISVFSCSTRTHTDTDDETPGEFVYSLLSAYQHLRLSTLRDVHTYLEKFISVQYNAILTQARLPNSNMYGKWTGPPATSFELQHQLSACYGLIAAIGLPEIPGLDTTTTSSLVSEPTNTDASDTPHGVNTGGIVGGVIGALGALVLLAVGLICWRRRRRTVVPQEASTAPFMLDAADVEPKSGGSKGRAVASSLHNPRVASLQEPSYREEHEPEPELLGVQHAVDDIGEEERHQDSGWRPGRRGLPPTYEDAL